MDWACQSCGTQEIGTRYPVLEKLLDGQQKEIYVCDHCKPHFESVELLIQRFDGTISPWDGRPKMWSNEEPLHYDHDHIIYYMLEQELSHLDLEQRAAYIQEHALDPAQLPLATFPLVDDFEILLEGPTARHKLNKEPITCFFASLYSPSRGYLGHLSGNDMSQNLCKPNFVIPHGDFTLPYCDFEQGVDLLIFEDNQFVYILSGDWERHNQHEPGIWYKIEHYYDSWVKVERTRYYEQWEIAIQHCRAYHMTGLTDEHVPQ